MLLCLEGSAASAPDVAIGMGDCSWFANVSIVFVRQQRLLLLLYEKVSSHKLTRDHEGEGD